MLDLSQFQRETVIARTKMMHRFAITTLCLLFSTSGAIANKQIPLVCEVQVQLHFNHRASDRLDIKSSITVVETADGNIEIRSDSKWIPLAYTVQLSNSTSENLSDSGKWHIRNRRLTDMDSKTEIRIDRYSGFISFSEQTTHSQTGNWMHSTGTGDCSRVDTTRRKF